MEGYFIYIANKLERLRLGPGAGGKVRILEELRSWDLWRAVLAELLATMLFVFIGTMSAVSITTGDDLSKIVRIALCFGFMIATCIQMIGHVSGGHMNPAVSIAMAVSLSITPTRAIFYVIAQCVGGIFGSLLLKSVTPDALHSNLGLTTVSTELTASQGFGCELVFTFILVLSIYGCTDSNRPMFGSPAVGIGITIAVVHLAGIPFTGASMNPARSLGSSVASESFDDHWVYWAGPILGGVLASLAYKYVLNPYRGTISMDDAGNKMLGDQDMILIPRDYFKGSSDNGRPRPGITKM